MKTFKCVQIDLGQIRSMVVEHLTELLLKDPCGLKERVCTGSFDEFNVDGMTYEQLYDFFRSEGLGSKVNSHTGQDVDFVYTNSEDYDDTLIVLWEKQQ